MVHRRIYYAQEGGERGEGGEREEGGGRGEGGERGEFEEVFTTHTCVSRAQAKAVGHGHVTYACVTNTVH